MDKRDQPRDCRRRYSRPTVTTHAGGPHYREDALGGAADDGPQAAPLSIPHHRNVVIIGGGSDGKDCWYLDIISVSVPRAHLPFLTVIKMQTRCGGTKLLAPPLLAWTFSLSSVSPIILHHIHLCHGQPVYRSRSRSSRAAPARAGTASRLADCSCSTASGGPRRSTRCMSTSCRVPPARRCRSQFSPIFFIFFCSFLSLSLTSPRAATGR